VKPCSTGEVLITFQNRHGKLESEAPLLLSVGGFSPNSGDNFHFACQLSALRKNHAEHHPDVNCISDLPRALASVTLAGAGWGRIKCIHLSRAAGAQEVSALFLKSSGTTVQ
jgi:hypothetical protein